MILFLTDVLVLSLICSDEFDAYIIVSFVNATLVLSIGETVEEVTDSGFLGTTPTLSCSLLGDDALVQVGVFRFAPVSLKPRGLSNLPVSPCVHAGLPRRDPSHPCRQACE